MIHLSLATCLLVFARAIQQQNVSGGHYLAAALTPFAIAAGEVATVLWVVQAGTWASVPWMGAGGALGATAAMYAHRRFQRET
jgi:hypothetical protein